MTGLHAPVSSAFATTDPEQAHAIVAAAYADNHLRVSGSLDNFRLEQAQQDLGAVTFSSARSTLTTEYAVDALDRVIIGRILRGGLTTESEHTERTVGPGQALLMARPGIDYTTRFEDYQASAIALDPTLLADVSDDGDGLAADQLTLDLLPPERARYWQRTVDYATDTLLSGTEAGSSPLVLGSTARLLASAALTVFGSRPEPRARDRADALPGTVRRAIAYIETNPDLDLGVADIARAGHVSVRALQLAFRRHRDTTPMRYLRRVRLDLARRPAARRRGAGNDGHRRRHALGIRRPEPVRGRLPRRLRRTPARHPPVTLNTSAHLVRATSRLRFRRIRSTSTQVAGQTTWRAG